MKKKTKDSINEFIIDFITLMTGIGFTILTTIPFLIKIIIIPDWVLVILFVGIFWFWYVVCRKILCSGVKE